MPTAPDPQRLAWENSQVLNLVQALLGAVTPNIRGVAIEFPEGMVRLHFVLGHENEDDRAEIEEVLFDFTALQSKNVDIDVVVSVSRRPTITPSGRWVYLCKEQP
jgi:hypothetical protein